MPGGGKVGDGLRGGILSAGVVGILGVLGCGASEVVPYPGGAMGCVLLTLASSLGASRWASGEG